MMNMRYLVLIAVVLGAFVREPGTALGAELPDGYFTLMAAGLKGVEPAPKMRDVRSYMFTAAVLYTKQHPANPGYGNEKLLDLALRLGDVAAEQSEQDASQNRQDYEWESHFWLDSYRLLEGKLSAE